MNDWSCDQRNVWVSVRSLAWKRMTFRSSLTPTSSSKGAVSAHGGLEGVEAVVELLSSHALRVGLIRRVVLGNLKALARDRADRPLRRQEIGAATTHEQDAPVARPGPVQKTGERRLVRRRRRQHQHLPRVDVGQRQRQDVNVGCVPRLDDQQVIIGQARCDLFQLGDDARVLHVVGDRP